MTENDASKQYGDPDDRDVPVPTGAGPVEFDETGAPGTADADPLAGVRAEPGGDMPTDQATAAGTPDAGPVSSRDEGEGRA